MRGRGKRGRARWAALAAACSLVLAGRAGAGPVEGEIVRRIFGVTGVGAEVGGIAPIAAAWFSQASVAPAPARMALRAIVEQGFAAATLERLAREAFLERFDPTNARTALRWLEQPAIISLHRAGRPAAGECDPRSEPVGAVRAAALARVEATTSPSTRSRHHASRVYVALLWAGNALLPETRRFSNAELADMIAEHRAGLQNVSDPAGQACRYRDFATDDLVAAEAFLETETGRWLYEGVSAAVDAALTRAARATALRIVETFGARQHVPMRIALAGSRWAPDRAGR